jgi:hypothetical protein
MVSRERRCVVKRTFEVAAWALCLVACAARPAGEDIEGAVFDSREASCEAYAGEYLASVQDVQGGRSFTSSVVIEAAPGACTITSNAIPNHDFNAMGRFATPVASRSRTVSVPSAPTFAASPTPLTLDVDDAIFLNGVKLDLLAAACYGVGPDPLGRERIGCFEPGTPWRYDPMSGENGFGTDEHDAHTQPDGQYHYHAGPGALYDASGERASGVIGFAADGFPIYGPFIDDGGTIRRVRSGYVLREGAREAIAGEGAFPGGDYDGTFVDDYTWREGAGDLDACNGMTVDGQYGYYVTDGYPWVMGCFKGTPDPSFRKRMGGPSMLMHHHPPHHHPHHHGGPPWSP